jgi:nucleoside-diphosphate-sugar epimerase
VLGSQIYATGVSGTIGKHLRNLVTEIEIDLSSPDKVFHGVKLSDASTIIHLGGIVGETLVQSDKAYASRVNIQGTRNLGEVALKNGCEKFLYVSTSHVYKQRSSCITESDSLEPTSYYSETKIEAERAITETLRESDVQLTILRVFSVLDWEMPPFTLGGAIERIINGDDINISNGDDERDFLTPKTVASIISELTNEKDLPSIINLCSSKATSVLNAATTMLRLAQSNQSHRIFSGHSRIPKIVGDNSLLKSILTEQDFIWNPSPYPVNRCSG